MGMERCCFLHYRKELCFSRTMESKRIFDKLQKHFSLKSEEKEPMKMKYKQRWLALFIAFVMLIGILPMTAFAEGHTHTESCYAQEGDLLCTLETSDGHTHNEDCYCAGGEYICGLEESEEHTHNDNCLCSGGELTCELEESERHIHDEDCYAKGGELICSFEEAALFEATALSGDLEYEDIVTILENDDSIDFDPETQSLLIINIDTEISEHLQNFGLSNAELENATKFSFLYQIYFDDTIYKGTCYTIDDDGNISVNESSSIGWSDWGTPITDTARNVIIVDKNTEYSVIPYCYKMFWGNREVEPHGNLMYVPMPLGQSEIDAKTGTISDSEAEITFSYLWDVYNWFELETCYLDTDSKHCDMAGGFDFDSSVDYLIELRDADGNISTFDTVYWDYGYDDDYTFCEDGVIHHNIEPDWEGSYGEGSFMFPAGYDFRIRVLQNGTELGTLMLVQHDTLKILNSGYGSFEYDEDGFCLCANDYLTGSYIISHYFIQPSSTIRVEKIVQGTDSEQSYDFSITRTVAEVSINTHSDTNWTLFPDITIPMINTDYTIYASETDEQVGTGRTDMQGKFTLKGGQYAIFDVWELPADIETYSDDYCYLDIWNAFDENNEELPTCSVYTVTEELPKNENCTTTVTHTKKDGTKSTVDGKVINGVLGGDTILFQNVYDNNQTGGETGSLKVSKTISGNAASTTKAFTFTVTLDDTSISGTYGDMVFENGVAVFTLKANESKTALELPTGIAYTVEESNNSGYKVTVNGSDQTTAAGTITADTTATETFNNHKSGSNGGGGTTIPSPAKVTITAQKTLDGSAAEGSDYRFVLKDESGNVIQTVQNNGGNITFAPLSFSKTGTYIYTLSEMIGKDSSITYDTSIYSITIDVTKSGDYKAAISYGKDGEPYSGIPVFVNTTKSTDDENETVTLSVSKVWNDGNYANRPASVSVQLYKDGTAYGEPVSLNAGNNWSYVWNNLAESATWTVDEVNVPDGYTKTVTQDGTNWVVTNTRTVPTDNPATPDEPDKPSIPTSPDTTTVPDEPVDSVPQTGDSSNIELWIALACLSLFSMLAALFGKKRLSTHK